MKYIIKAKNYHTVNRFRVKTVAEDGRVAAASLGMKIDVLFDDINYGPAFKALLGICEDGNMCMAVFGVGRNLVKYSGTCPWSDGYDDKIMDIYIMETKSGDRERICALYLAFLKDPYGIGNQLLKVIQLPVPPDDDYRVDVERLNGIVQQNSAKQVKVDHGIKKLTLISFFSYTDFSPNELIECRKSLYRRGISHLEHTFVSSVVDDDKLSELKKELASGCKGVGYFIEYAVDRIKHTFKKSGS